MGGAKSINKLRFQIALHFRLTVKPNEPSLQKLYSERESDTFLPDPVYAYIHSNIYRKHLSI